MKKEIKLEFKNKKGEKKKVKFYIEEETFNMLQKSNIEPKDKERYLLEKYHEYELERYYKRKYELCDEEIIEEINYHKNISNYKEEIEKSIKINRLKEEINKLKTKEKEMIELIYYQGKTQEEVGDIYGVSKQAINKKLKKIYEKLRKEIKKI